MTKKVLAGLKVIFCTVCVESEELTLCLLFFISGKEIIKRLLNRETVFILLLDKFNHMTLNKSTDQKGSKLDRHTKFIYHQNGHFTFYILQ